MKSLGLVLAALALQIAGCGLDEDKTSGAKLDGYLFDACPWQAFPSLPDAGEGCYLDIFLSVGAPQGTVPKVCGAEPTMSLCWLDALGHAVDPTRFVVLDGSEEVQTICAINDKDPDGAPTCTEQAVFVPSSIRAIEGRTGATQ